MIVLLAGSCLLMQDPDLVAVRQSEQRRIEVMARCAPAVCSVMEMDAPGGGSGVIFDPAGFVLTNYHVVGEPARPKPTKKGEKEAPFESPLPKPPEPPTAELEAWQREHPGADEAAKTQFIGEWQQRWRDEFLPTGKYHWANKKVGLPDGQLYEGVVLGVDPGSDLAVLRLLPKHDGQRWPWCKLGDSDQLLVGETVFAMGNPFLLATDFTPTTTWGIVSGTHRYQEGGGNRMLVYPDCIQVDAPINPGNSGGPLFNEAGEVVGINGRISIGDRDRVNVGVGFAISSNQIANFLGDLLAGRHAEHGTLDMSAWYMTAPGSESKRRGVFVQQIFKDAVAAAAGVGVGDEVTWFDGVEVRSANQLATMVGVLPAGAWITLGYRKSHGDDRGPEQRVEIRLAALDTGSSSDNKVDGERLASRANRRLAAQTLLERWAEAGAGTTSDFSLHAPDGVVYRYRRSGERLRADLGALTLVRSSAADGFAIADGAVRDLTPEERAYLDRQLACNPLLWPAGARANQLEAALLAGGNHVLGRPSWRFEVPGDGELATLVAPDGSAAGYRLRDPLRKQMIELHVRGTTVRLVADGVNEPGWSLVPPIYERIADDVFGRPR